MCCKDKIIFLCANKFYIVSPVSNRIDLVSFVIKKIPSQPMSDPLTTIAFFDKIKINIAKFYFKAVSC